MLATIEKIENVALHPNAERLDIVTVGGYNCVVGRDSYQIGDMCILIQPDTVLPDADWAKLYTANNPKRRVRAIKLRGEWSFGIVEKMTLLGDGVYEVGQDVSGLLGITKYEPVTNEPGHVGGLPHGIPKTDQTRYQGLRKLPYGKEVYVTLKIDGQSATYFVKDGTFGVTSRSMAIDPSVENRYTTLANKYDLQGKLVAYCEKHGVNLALRGEVYGVGIQNYNHNPHAKLSNDVSFFDVWSIDQMRYLMYDEPHGLLALCNELDLPTVLIIEESVLTPALIEHYRDSKRLDKAMFEGVVIRTKNAPSISFKVINLHYDSLK